MYNIKYIVFVMFFKCMTKRISTFLHFHSFYTWANFFGNQGHIPRSKREILLI